MIKNIFKVKKLLLNLVILQATLSPGFAFQEKLEEMLTSLMEPLGSEAGKVIAVIPFETGHKVKDDAGLSVAEYSVVFFKNYQKHTVVERTQFAKVLEEMELAQSDLVEESKQIELGKMLSANWILVGSVTEAFGKRNITARMVDVNTAEVLSSKTVVVGPESMDNFMKELLGEKGQVSAAIFRSAVVPGWGQFFTNHPVRGSLSLALFLGAAGTGVFYGIQSASAQSDYEAFSVDDEQQRLIEQNCDGLSGNELGACGNEQEPVARQTKKDMYSDYEDARSSAILWGVITGGVYLVNLGDAALAGLQAKSKFDLYFSAIPGRSLGVNLAYQF